MASVMLAGAAVHGEASLILSPQPAWNGWSVEVRSTAGYRESGGAGVASTTDTQYGLVLPQTPAGTVVTVSAHASALPGAGLPKDKAEGSLEFNYIVGTAATADTFSVSVNGQTSAYDAKVDFGAGPVPADAFYECELILRTFAPIAAGPAIRLPALPELADPVNESMSATVTAGLLSGFMLPGDPELAVPVALATGEVFEYRFTYSVVTPYGTDPAFSITLTGTASAGPAGVNVVPNGGFEVLGPASSPSTTTTPGAADPSAADAWSQSLVNGSYLTTVLLPSSNTLAGDCGNMLLIETDGVSTGSGASPVSVNLPVELPIGSEGWIDILVLDGMATIGFAVNTDTATVLDGAVTVDESVSGWQHVRFSNATLPTSQIQIQVSATRPGDLAIVLVDNAGARAAGAPRASRFDFPNGFPAPQRWISNFAYPDQIPAVGDFDGDGLDDIVTFLRSAYAGTGQEGHVYVARNNGGGFDFAGLWQEFFCILDETPAVGDFDGDGRDDIATFVPSTGRVFVSLSTGSSFCGGREWDDPADGGFMESGAVPAVGDVDGDGRDDILLFRRGASGDVLVALSTGRGFGPKALWMTGFCTGAAVPRVGDVDGDGRADIVCFVRDSRVGSEFGDVEVALSTGSAFAYAGAPAWHLYFAPGAAFEPLLADMNGDGSDDIMAVYENGDIYCGIKGAGANAFFSDPTGTNNADPFWFGGTGLRANINELPLAGHFNRDLNADVCTFVFGQRGGDDFAATFVSLGGNYAAPILNRVAAPRGAHAGDLIEVTGNLGPAGWQERVRLIGPDNTLLTPGVESFSPAGGTFRVPTGCYPGGLYRLLVFYDANEKSFSTSWPVVLTSTEDAWRRAHFSPWEIFVEGLADDGADPDMDDLPNLGEFLFGRNPRAGEFPALAWERVGYNQWLVPFEFRADRGCVKVTIRHSDDLSIWHDGDAFVFEGTGGVGETGSGFLITPPNTDPRHFAQLEFSRP